MYTHRHWPEDGADHQAATRQTASLAGVVIILMLLVGGLFLIQHLHRSAMIEDCLLAGRRNCDALVTGQH